MRRAGCRGGLAVSRYAEYEALGAIGNAYEAWTEANTRLDEQVTSPTAGSRRLLLRRGCGV
ncbi:MAG: hypothetical protein QOI39_2179 [Mycobacterium sp.]|nr:hypothetical protein [Mycobacterium sp.]